MKTTSKVLTLDQFKDKHYGPLGSEARDVLEKGYQEFRLGAMIQSARLEKGMTQEQLATKVGTTKSYISKIENNIKEARISTLQKIVELGLGGTHKKTE
jgi:ribosome-binding protein aMBF1 (putative translation factor)